MGAAPRQQTQQWELALAVLALGWFAVRLVYFALQISAQIPPDELSHFGRCQAFARVPGLPLDGPETYRFGLIQHTPYLYYWLMGRLLALIPAAWNGLVFLRLVNAVLGLGTACIAWRWIGRVSDDPLVRSLFLVVLTNVLMFTGLSASVSYDNLTNTLAAAAFYFLFRFWQSRRSGDLAGFAVSVLAGCLTKTTYLPLAAILTAGLLWHERDALLDLGSGLRAALASARAAQWLLYALAGLLLAANLALYGGNLLRFGHLEPGFAKVVGAENARQNRVFARNHVLAAFRSGELSFEQAARRARRLPDEADRATALNLLQMARNPELMEQTLMDPPAYAFSWAHMMSNRALGYAGHQLLMKSRAEYSIYFALASVAALLGIRRMRFDGSSSGLAWSAFFAGAYALVLLWGVNYPAYAKTGVLGLGSQGRYLFPVLLPLCGLFAHYLLDGWPQRVRLLLALLTAAWFVYGDLPFFVLHATPVWFRP